MVKRLPSMKRVLWHSRLVICPQRMAYCRLVAICR